MKPTTASTADAVVPTGGRMGHREDRRDPRRRADSRSVTGETSRGAVAGTSTARAWTLEVAARDYIWLYDFRHGVGLSEIAAREGVTVRQVREGLERARALDRNRLERQSDRESQVEPAGRSRLPFDPALPDRGVDPAIGLPASRFDRARLATLLHGLPRFRDG